MNISYWDCKFGDADDVNYGTDEEPDYEYVYYCQHPKTKSGRCDLDNKYCEDNDDCLLLDLTEDI